MPKFNHEDLEAVLNVIYRKGIITAVDAENDTADVDVPGGQSGSGVPIYYHCDPDSELRSNGAIYGGASAFSAGTEEDPEADPPVEAVEGDSVIVMCDTEGVPLRIIGFVDGIRSCCHFLEPFDGPPMCLNNWWRCYSFLSLYTEGPYYYSGSSWCADEEIAPDRMGISLSDGSLRMDYTYLANGGSGHPQYYDRAYFYIYNKPFLPTNKPPYLVYSGIEQEGWSEKTCKEQFTTLHIEIPVATITGDPAGFGAFIRLTIYYYVEDETELLSKTYYFAYKNHAGDSPPSGETDSYVGPGTHDIEVHGGDLVYYYNMVFYASHAMPGWGEDLNWTDLSIQFQLNNIELLK